MKEEKIKVKPMSDDELDQLRYDIMTSKPDPLVEGVKCECGRTIITGIRQAY